DQSELSRAGQLVYVLSNYGQYIVLFFLPHNLSVLHKYSTLNLPALWATMSFLAISGGTYLSVKHAKSSGGSLVGWLWFLGTLVPVIGLIQVGVHSYAERYMYWSCPGLIILVVNWIPEKSGKSVYRHVLIVTAILILSTISFSRNLEWKNTVTLFRSALRVDPNLREGWAVLADFYSQKGQHKEAIYAAKKVFQCDPNGRESRLNYVISLHYSKGINAAEEELSLYLKDYPEDDVALKLKGEMCYSKGEYKEAIKHLENSLKVNVFNVSAYSRLADCFQKIEDPVNEKRHRRIVKALNALND
ncbi:MAG: hypothetical protein P1V97_15510, partial [Planctomycetota bacterium]|nr:hypothetical protein [Planctomycetota bacterium]